jgi:hypothetical protein
MEHTAVLLEGLRGLSFLEFFGPSDSRLRANPDDRLETDSLQDVLQRKGGHVNASSGLPEDFIFLAPLFFQRVQGATNRSPAPKKMDAQTIFHAHRLIFTRTDQISRAQMLFHRAKAQMYGCERCPNTCEGSIFTRTD